MIKWYLTKLGERDILTIICTFATIGIVALICDLCLLMKRKWFGEEYLLKFNQFVEGDLDEEKHYQWLLRKVSKIENDMDRCGLAYTYRPPFANYALQNYMMLSNTLVNIGPVSAKDLEICQAVLERYIGTLEDEISKKFWHLINPIIWLTRTVRLILLDILLWVLNSFGLISGNTKNRIRYSSIVSKVIGLISFLGALASIVALVFLLSELLRD